MKNAKDKQILDQVLKDTGKMVMSSWKDDVKVLMPFQVAIMRSDMSKIHQNTILLILEKIKKQLMRALSGTKQEKKELVLFPEQEFGADPNVIKMQIYYKDFGVSSSNYSYP